MGAGVGLVGSALAVGIGVAALHARGIDVTLDGGDFALLIAGGAAPALLAAIGVGIGAVVRHQVPTLIGICAWLLFVEGLLVGDVAGIRKVGKFAPGVAGQALSGQFPGVLLSTAAAGLVLAAYAIRGCNRRSDCYSASRRPLSLSRRPPNHVLRIRTVRSCVRKKVSKDIVLRVRA
jgi:hypothetical protein